MSQNSLFMHNFLVLVFLFLFLIHNLKWWFQFKTSSNLPLKIFCEIIVDVKKKKIRSRPTTIGNKRYCENVMIFYCVPRLLFWFSKI